jgi:uncharacterized protein YfiM (DUF2279 family)
MLPRFPALAATLLLAVGLAAAPAPAAAQVLSAEDTARLRVYYEAIGPAVAPLTARASIADLLPPLFRLATTRSADNPLPAEHRAALLALALYVNGKDPARLIPEARAWRRPPWRRLQLGGRGDLAQHFTISAAIAATAGAPIAHVIGLYKEIDDARRGGGFSFSDLLADRAGTTFGDTATSSLESARRLQARLTDPLADADILPAVDGLPPDVSEREYTRRYRGGNEAAFRNVVAEIDRRIAALAIFAPPQAAGR